MGVRVGVVRGRVTCGVVNVAVIAGVGAGVCSGVGGNAFYYLSIYLLYIYIYIYI